MSSFPQFTLVKDGGATGGVCRGCGTYCSLPLTVAYPDKSTIGRFCSILCWYGYELRARTGGEAA